MNTLTKMIAASESVSAFRAAITAAIPDAGAITIRAPAAVTPGPTSKAVIGPVTVIGMAAAGGATGCGGTADGVIAEAHRRGAGKPSPRWAFSR